MKLYECKVRLGGSVADEVRKSAVTAAEISVLQHIHGEDAVLEVRETAEKAFNLDPNHPRYSLPRTEDDELDRLGAVYGEQVVQKVFGPRTRKVTDLSVDVEPLPRRTRVERKPDPVAEAAAATAAPSLMD